MSNSIDQIIRRTQRYWYVDGLNEIAVGIVVLSLGLYYLALKLFVPAALTALWIGIGQPVIILLAWWPGGKLVRWLKMRITYPRTGYVAYPPRQGKKQRALVSLIIAAVVAGMVLLLKTVFQVAQSTLPLIVGTMIAIAVALLGMRFALYRFYILAIYTLLLGLLTSRLPLVELEQNAFLFAGFGLGWIASGAFTLLHYLKTTQPFSEVEG